MNKQLKTRRSLAAFLAASSMVLAGFSVPATANDLPASTELVDSLIVKYEPGVAITDASGDPNGTDSLTNSIDYTVGENIGSGYRTINFDQAISLDQAKEIASRLEGTSAVATADPNATMYAFETQDVTTPLGLWGLDLLDSGTRNNTYTYSSDGAGVNVYIVDSGIVANHNEFLVGGVSRVSTGADFVGDGQGTTDCNGHGTHVAGIAGGNTTGVAKSVNLIPLRVLRCDGTGQVSWTDQALQWILDNHQHPAVVNMSLGTSGTINSTLALVQALIDHGVVVVIASGNGSQNPNGSFRQKEDACNYTPAQASNAITVNSAGRGLTDHQVTTYVDDSYFSNYGTCTDIYAPGLDIYSADYGSVSGYLYKSGTSMASPLVAGVVANMLSENSTLTPAQVWANIDSSALNNVISSGFSGDTTKFIQQPSNGWNTYTSTSINAEITPATQSISGTSGSAISNTTAFTYRNFGFTPTYSISSALPSGLSLNTSTGVISGTPASSMASTSFTVTATGGGKTATSTVTIAISDPPAAPAPAPASGGGGGAVAAAPAQASGSVAANVVKKRTVAINLSVPAGSRTALQIYTNGTVKVAYQKAGKTKYKNVKTKVWKTVYSAASKSAVTVKVKSAGTYRVYVTTPSGPIEGAAFTVR
jgi:subtilisin family serine protease